MHKILFLLKFLFFNSLTEEDTSTACPNGSSKSHDTVGASEHCDGRASRRKRGFSTGWGEGGGTRCPSRRLTSLGRALLLRYHWSTAGSHAAASRRWKAEPSEDCAGPWPFPTGDNHPSLVLCGSTSIFPSLPYSLPPALATIIIPKEDSR